MGFTYTPDTLTAKESGLDLLAVSALIPVPSEHLIIAMTPASASPRISRQDDRKLPGAVAGRPVQDLRQRPGHRYLEVATVSAGDNGYPVMMAKQADCTQAGVFEPSFYKADTGKDPVTFYYTVGSPRLVLGDHRRQSEFAKEHPTRSPRSSMSRCADTSTPVTTSTRRSPTCTRCSRGETAGRRRIQRGRDAEDVRASGEGVRHLEATAAWIRHLAAVQRPDGRERRPEGPGGRGRDRHQRVPAGRLRVLTGRDLSKSPLRLGPDRLGESNLVVEKASLVRTSCEQGQGGSTRTCSMIRPGRALIAYTRSDRKIASSMSCVT